jgi:hypothetical protein
MVTDCALLTVIVSGWDETLPLEPLKLSALVERLMLLLWARAQTGLAIRIAASGRRTDLFKDAYSREIGGFETDTGPGAMFSDIASGVRIQK